MRYTKAEKTEKIDDEADNNETKKHNTSGSTGELYTHSRQGASLLGAPPPRGHRQHNRFYSRPISSHLISTHHRPTSTHQPISRQRQLPIRQPPHNVGTPYPKINPAANISASDPTAPVLAAFAFGSQRTRAAGMRHTARLCSVSFRRGSATIRAGS